MHAIWVFFWLNAAELWCRNCVAAVTTGLKLWNPVLTRNDDKPLRVEL